MNKTIVERIASLTLGIPARHRNLAVFPFVADGVGGADYLVLDEALERGLARVTEVSESGSVPELAFENGAGQDVLLLDGEELFGARQNRILNVTVLVGPKHRLVIPVSCVERGRWAYRSRQFASVGRKLYARARAAKMAQVSIAMEHSGWRSADQAYLWQDIAGKQPRMAVGSHTEAMSDLYDTSADALAGYRQAFVMAPGQVGAVFAVNGAVRGVEILDCPDTFARFLAKLVGSYAMDALDTADPVETVPSLEAAGRLLARISAASAKVFPGLDKGEDVRLEGAGLTGGALVVDGRVVHLAAFALDDGAS